MLLFKIIFLHFLLIEKKNQLAKQVILKEDKEIRKSWRLQKVAPNALISLNLQMKRIFSKQYLHLLLHILCSIVEESQP